MATRGNDLTLKLGFDIEKFSGDLRKAEASFSKFGKNLETGIKGFFAIETLKIVSGFAFEVSKLAGEAQGVKEAFDKLPQSVSLMNDLKKATGGTVSELELMKRSVMASNFDISLKALPQLLEFATLRAKQTGQSVDYLVDSIVTGIGRKSKLILDNLGISAVQLTEALGGASAASSTIGEVADAVGKIAAKNLETMGKLSENVSTKTERLSASWTNLKVSMGDAANGTGILGKAMDALTERMNLLASANLTFWDKFNVILGNSIAMNTARMKEADAELKKLNEDTALSASITRQAQQAIATFGNDLDKIKDAYKLNINFQKIMNEVNRLLIEDDKKKAELIRNEKNLTEELNNLREESSLAVGKERAAINKQIEAIEKEIQALRTLGVEKKKVALGSGPMLQEKVVGFGSGPKKKEESIWLGDGPVFDEEAWDKMHQKMEAVATTAARIGDAIGQGLGDAITGAGSFAQAMGQMAVSVVASLERIVLANMVASSSKFGLAGIIAAAAGFGVVKSLFGRIGNAGSMKSGFFGGGSGGRQRLEAKVSGRDLKFVLTQQDTYDTRVKTT